MADRFGYGEIGLDIHPCRGCEDYDESDGCKSNGGCGKPITNADKIRAMTDEELSKQLWNIRNAERCVISGQKRCIMFDDCIACWLDWLKREAAE